MAKRRQETEGESSRGQEGRRRRRLIMDESSSASDQSTHLIQWERYLLKNSDSNQRYAQDFNFRDIELERAVNMNWLQGQESLEVGSWLESAGLKDFVTMKMDVYPRLVRILYANLDPTSMVSWVGAYKVKLNEEIWCKVFKLPNLSGEDEAPLNSIPKQEIFRGICNEEHSRNRSWINANELPKDASIRLAINIIMSTLLPKKRNKDQIKEREGRLLYALMHGKKINFGKEIVSHIRQAFSKKSLPLCFPMHLMKIMEEAKVDMEIAGTIEVKRLNEISMIDGRTLGRLGFKRDHTHWVFVGRGNVKQTPLTGSIPAATEGKEGEEEEGTNQRMHEDTPGHEESTPPSATPPPIAQQLTNLQNSIAHLSSHLTERLDYLSATLHSKLDFMDARLGNIHLRLRSCETKLDQLTSESPFPSPSYSPNAPTPQPSPTHSDSWYEPPTTPINISSNSETTLPSMPQPTPTSPSQPTPLAITPHFRSKKCAVKRSSLQSKKPSSSA